MVRSDWLWLVSIFLGLFGVHLLVGKLPCTGDEARYAYQGVGLYTTLQFNPAPEQWMRFASANGCPSIEVANSSQAHRPLQTFSTSLAFGSMLLFGLEAARWLNFLIGCAALALLYLLLKRLYPGRNGAQSAAGIASIAAIAVSIPFVEYLKLIYPEMLLFAMATAALYGLLLHKRYVATVAAIVLPFLHIRALPLSLVFVALQNRLRDWALYSVGLAIFAATQIWFFGSLTGSAFPSYAPSLSLFVQRIGMQLYDVRHGAIAYAPLLLIGFSGLIAGAIRRERACIFALILFATYFATFMWSSASESWTARFWVAALPFLASGTCSWLSRATQWWEWLPAAPLAALNALHAVFFAIYPIWYLESRQSSIPYAALFLMTHVHLGLFLPVDALPGGIAAYAGPIGYLLVYTALVVVLLAACRAPLSARKRAAFCFVTVLVVASPFVFGLARTIDPARYSLTVHASQHELAVRFDHSIDRVDAIQFDDQIPSIWPAPPFPSEFTIRCMSDGRVTAEVNLPAHALLILDRCASSNSLDVVGYPLGGSDRFFRHLGAFRLIQRAL